MRSAYFEYFPFKANEPDADIGYHRACDLAYSRCDYHTNFKPQKRLKVFKPCLMRRQRTSLCIISHAHDYFR